MANCDVWTLAENLACWCCFNPVLQDGVTLALLEAITTPTPPVPPTSDYEATDQGIRVTTDDGQNIVLNI